MEKYSTRILMHKILLKTAKYNRYLDPELYTTGWGTLICDFYKDSEYLSLEVADGVFGYFTDGKYEVERDNLPFGMVNLLIEDLKLLFDEK